MEGQPDSRDFHLRIFTSATSATATAKTLTQTGHVAPRFCVPRERLNVRGAGKNLLFINALIIISCLSKALIVHLELEQFGNRHFLWQLPKSYIL